MRKGKCLTMQEPIVNESPRRRIARRIGAAGLALATILTLTACREARGGGQIDEPAQGSVIPVDIDIDGAYQGEANFGFTFTCDVNTKAKRAEIKGQITYHDTGTSVINVPVDDADPYGPLVEKPFPEIRIHGIVDPIFVEGVLTCEEVLPLFPGTARFGGTYRSQDTTLAAVQGRFRVGVFDQGEPGVSRDVIDGDGFSIQLTGGPPTYNGYTRAGYIEGGNIQVE